ncbi:MAG TPA: hypothetical protein PKL83_02825 [bacterium]|nr:hypothetical protein [bacterium]
MAKPTTHAPQICTAVSICAIIGIIAGLVNSNPLLIIMCLLPAAIYEAYRTEGKSTKAASYLLLAVVIIELLLVFFDIDFNLASYLGTSEKSIGGYLVPLGNIKIVGPTLMGILAVILFVRTRGIYTRWLAVTIFITALAIVYAVDPAAFQDLMKYVAEEGLNTI